MIRAELTFDTLTANSLLFLPSIRLLKQEVDGRYGSGTKTTEERMVDYIADNNVHPKALYILATYPDDIIAAASVQHGQILRGDTTATWIKDLAVKPNMHGKGHGRRMITHLAQTALEAGDTTLSLYVPRKGDQTPQEFYEKLGFTGSNGYFFAEAQAILEHS